MKMLKLDKSCIKAFKNGEIWESEGFGALYEINEEEQKIVFYRFFCGYTQNRVALTLNMTQVQVSRKEKKIMEKMRKKLS